MDSDLVVDGNAVAGLLNEIFVHEITAAATGCDGCGAVEPIGALVAYVRGPGAVLRCRHCDSVMVRVVCDGTRSWLDLRGVRWLEFGV